MRSLYLNLPTSASASSIIPQARGWAASMSKQRQATEQTSNSTESKQDGADVLLDEEYPGTAVARLKAVHLRVAQLVQHGPIKGDWEDVRRKLLWAGGLKDLPNARPGMGYTGHSFNDWNHCDLTTMSGAVAGNLNQGQVQGIQYQNQLGPGIQIASLPELGPGGSWSTCLMGCQSDPPRDVAHLQFRSRIAFKLVWVPPDYAQFVLVDDGGALLAVGQPSGRLPPLAERRANFQAVKGSKYAVCASKLSAETAVSNEPTGPTLRPGGQ
eukprot:g767.t1